ncbi:endonuclease/exonuclease/phosphatase family protein [Caenimonas soli]|uniref:endonuclease/exonuclease/phosphatase family protein n=1 Tax=Caenimonas soli TaxID=2735555 RepID=UPI001552850D|nr:endonuclease/exonuclease/phosphatase family protein [Caenimonas soli]NPC54585.1 endonuclease [Caenimonas soli]
MKLITWNIQWGRGADGRVDLDRIVAHAQRFADFDVLCLQEVSAGHHQLPGCDGSDQFEQLAARLPGYEPVAGVAVDTLGTAGERRRFGNMLFSRLPVRQVFRHLLPWPTEDGVMSMQRVAIEATLDTPLGPLRVTTTHLEYYSPRQRDAQIDRLRELHRDSVARSHMSQPGDASHGPFEAMPHAAAAVLLGDCNFRPDEPDHARVLAPIDSATPAYQDAWEVTHPGRAHEPTVGVHDKAQWPGPPFTFDLIFVSADIAHRVRDVRVDGTTDASDHQPVLVELA